MSKKQKKMEYSSDQSLGMLAGCPFSGFGPCQAEKCVFFVAVPPDLKERACVITASYVFQSMKDVLETTVFLERTLEKDGILPKSHVAAQVAESLVGCLDRLDGIYGHPKTDESLKELIRTLKGQIRYRLETFAES